jgi:hypothetical protein
MRRRAAKIRPRPTSGAEAVTDEQPTQSAQTTGENSPAINIAVSSSIHNYPKWLRNFGLITLTLLTSCVIYLVLNSTYNDKQRNFDDIYGDNFSNDTITAEQYKKHHLELNDLAENIPIAKEKWQDYGSRKFVYMLFMRIGDIYRPLSNCLNNNSCEPGWNIWRLCYNARKDMRAIEYLRRDIISSGLHITYNDPKSEDEFRLEYVGELQNVLKSACKAKFLP